MANFSLGEAVLGTAMDLAGLKKGMGQAEGESRSLWSKIGSIGEKALGVLTGNLATKGFDALLGAVQSVGDTLLNEAPRVEGLRTSFDNLAESAGFSGEAVMDSLRAAAKGMVTDVSLMESFNKSMLLVGEGMADKLPKLLEIAQASAAATGEDVGFLLDSLVTGIGRGSPMILDNLGLTINLAEAYEGYAKTLGIATDEMTKAQQQEALLNAVVAAGDGFIERLGDNAGGTAQTMAQFKTTIENLKMGLATGLLPALAAIITPLVALAMEHLPKLIPLVENFGNVFGAFIKVVLSGSDPLNSFGSMLSMLGVPPGIVSGYRDIVAWFRQLIDAIQGFVAGFKDEGIYIGIENFLAAFDIQPPEALWYILDTVINVFDAIKYWGETNWPIFQEAIIGVFTTIKGWVETNWPIFRETVVGVIEQIKGWFDANGSTIFAGIVTGVSVVIATVMSFVQVLWPALQSAFGSIQSIVQTLGEHLAALGIGWDTLGGIALGVVVAIGAAFVGAVAIVTGLVQGISNALASLASFFEAQSVRIQTVINNFKVWIDALKVFFMAAFANDLPGALTALGDVFQAFGPLVGSVLDAFVAGVAGAVDLVLSFLGGFIDGIAAFVGSWSGNFATAASAVLGFVDKVKSAMSGVSDAIGGVLGWVQKLIEKLGGIELPKWMTPGSPTPWELGLRGVADALNEVNTAQLSQLGAGLGGIPAPALADAGAGGGVTVNLNLSGVTINDQRDLETLAWQLSSMIGAQLQARRV